MKESAPAPRAAGRSANRSAGRLLVIGARWPLETFIENLLRGLGRAGWSVTIASRQPFGRAAWPLRRLPIPGDGALRLLPHLPRLAMSLLRQPLRAARLLRGRPDKLHQMRILLPMVARDFDLFYFPWNGAALDYLPLFELGIPTLVSCRGSHIQVSPHNPRRSDLRRDLPRLFAAATAVHGVSREILQQAAALGLDLDKSSVIHPAVDLGFFSPPPARASAEDRPLRLIGAGSLIWRKGFEYALRALAELRRRGVEARLTLVGEGADRQRLLFAIDELGLGDRVELTGKLPPGALRDLLRASDVFLLPSVSEGISNAALEAMACGLPVVASDCGGMSEAIENGASPSASASASGLLVPPRDPRAIADAVERLAADAQLRAGIGRAARRRVERFFGLDSQVAAFDRLLRGLLAEAQPTFRQPRADRR